MLLKNPQLAYALLQAQVVMRIVNPDTARRMLHPKSGPTRQPAYQRFNYRIFRFKSTSFSAPQQEQRRPQYEENSRQPPAYPSSYNQPAG